MKKIVIRGRTSCGLACFILQGGLGRSPGEAEGSWAGVSDRGMRTRGRDGVSCTGMDLNSCARDT